MHWPRLALVLGLVLMVAASFAGPTAGNAVADMDEGHAIAVFHVGDSMTEQAQTLIAYGELVLFDSQPRAVAVAPELEANNQGVVAIIPAPAWREFVAMIGTEKSPAVASAGHGQLSTASAARVSLMNNLSGQSGARYQLGERSSPFGGDLIASAETTGYHLRL